MPLTAADLASLRRQRRLSLVFAVPLSFGVAAAARLYFRYRLDSGIDDLRRDLWKRLDAHDGPVIWAANHLTLIDSFLVYWAVVPWSRIGSDRLTPWSTPEYTNYYRLGGPLQAAAIRGLLYLCRCIPFLRGGEDAQAENWRQNAFEKCEWVLQNGGSIFVYPEAGRARSGWFEARRPKDFLGRLAMINRRAKFLCVYLRAEDQAATTAAPSRGAVLRSVCDVVDAALPEENHPREISERLFHKIAELQEAWWKGSPMTKNCGGNDVVDLRAEGLREHFSDALDDADEDWLNRHLTVREMAEWRQRPPADRFRGFWKVFAAKEAAFKAFARAGFVVPQGGFREIEVDVFRRKAVHVVSGLQADIRFVADDAEKIHCVCVLRGGFIGEDDAEGDVLWTLAEVPPGESPGEFVRDLAVRFIAEQNDEIRSLFSLAVTEKDGMPLVFWKGESRDWSLSLSHAGRFAGVSFMIS